MEQNGKDKKPFNKKKNYHSNSKPSSGAAGTKRGRAQSAGKAQNVGKAQSAGRAAENDNGAAREPAAERSAQRKKRQPDYSDSCGLIESFEAAEKKQKKSNGRDTAQGAKSSNKNANKGTDKSTNRSASSGAGKSFDRNVSKRSKSNSNDFSKKRAGGKRHEEGPDDSGIKTRADNKYIPIDYSDDDIIPEEAFSFDYTEIRKNNKSFTTAGEIRSNAAVAGAVVGRNAVRELLRSDRSVDKLYVKSGTREGSIVVIVAEALSRKIPISEVSQDKLDALSGGANHQGVVALAAEKQYTDIGSILKIAEDRGEMPLVVIADGIEDPQNLGAVIRCAECAGVHGIIIPKRRAVGLTPAVTKASAGAIEHMAIAKVSNLADAIEKLKKAGLWIFAAEAGGTPYYEADFKVPAAIVFGSEGFGVGKLIREKSDFTVSIPMYGRVNSLNVATAASVILCHAARIHHT